MIKLFHHSLLYNKIKLARPKYSNVYECKHIYIYTYIHGGICRSHGECFLAIMRVPIERSEIQETTCQNEFTFDPCTLYIRFVHTMQSIGSCRLPFPLSDCGTSVWRPPLRFISAKFRRILIMYVTCSNLWYMYIYHIYIYIHAQAFSAKKRLADRMDPIRVERGTNNPFKSS